LRDVKISHAMVEDALHFLRSQVILDNVEIQDTQSDAIVADFSVLQINGLVVTAAGVLGDVGGDGLDVSGVLHLDSRCTVSGKYR